MTVPLKTVESVVFPTGVASPVIELSSTAALPLMTYKLIEEVIRCRYWKRKCLVTFLLMIASKRNLKQ